MPQKPTRGGFRPGPPRPGGGGPARPGGGGGARPGGGGGGGARPGGGGGNRPGGGGNRPPTAFVGTPPPPRRAPVARPTEPVVLPAVISVGDLAERYMVTPTTLITALIKNGVFATVNQQIDFAAAAKAAATLEIQVEQAEQISAADDIREGTDTRATTGGTEPRPPIITIMGHVDHGKTKLLDSIRETKVQEGEAGGITQRIGAYQVEVQGRKITFLDTPGHEAFTAMRARGASVTDIAVLVVAADDGVMPQTKEAISHAKAAHVPIVVAINKIDAPGANPERIKTQLSENEVMPEEYGGDTPVVEVSAREKLGIDDLLETLLLVADVAELKANSNTTATGVVIESRRDPNRGPMATVLVQNGTLNLRDAFVAGTVSGSVRAMTDDRGRKVRRALPSFPVEITGFDGVPEAGDTLVVMDEREARALAERRQIERQGVNVSDGRLSLENALRNVSTAGTKELRLIVKAAEQGSIAAIENQLNRIESEMVQISVLHTGVGAIGESDISLASASQAIILGYNVRPDVAGKRAAEARGVDVRFYNVIYTLIDDVRAAMSGLLDPVERETTDGYAEVRELFKLPNRIVAAGLYVTDGVIRRNDRVRVLRNGAVVHDGTVTTLRRIKEDAREVRAGLECGLSLDGFNEYEIGDSLEFYHKDQIAAVLS